MTELTQHKIKPVFEIDRSSGRDFFFFYLIDTSKPRPDGIKDRLPADDHNTICAMGTMLLTLARVFGSAGIALVQVLEREGKRLDVIGLDCSVLSKLTGDADAQNIRRILAAEYNETIKLFDNMVQEHNRFHDKRHQVTPEHIINNFDPYSHGKGMLAVFDEITGATKRGPFLEAFSLGANLVRAVFTGRDYQRHFRSEGLHA